MKVRCESCKNLDSGEDADGHLFKWCMKGHWNSDTLISEEGYKAVIGIQANCLDYSGWLPMEVTDGFRVCRNKYGWYKIQRWKPSPKIFQLFKIYGKWVDGSFTFTGNICIKYKTRDEALQVVANFIKRTLREDNSYVEESLWRV